MALLFGALTLNLFVYAFSILFGVELFASVEDVYLAWAGFFAQFQSPNLFTLAAREFVLGSVQGRKRNIHVGELRYGLDGMDSEAK